MTTVEGLLTTIGELRALVENLLAQNKELQDKLDNIEREWKKDKEIPFKIIVNKE